MQLFEWNVMVPGFAQEQPFVISKDGGACAAAERARMVQGRHHPFAPQVAVAQ